MNRSALGVYMCTAAALLFASVTTASAQYRPQPAADPATGETFHIEAAAGFWMPSADIQVASESLGIAGTSIDFKRDLGLEDQRFGELQLVLRPARSHKFRFQYIPITYEPTTTLTREIVFNGQKYQLGLPVNSTLDWKAYRFGYEYDFVVKDRGFAGLILDAKYTDVNVSLVSPIKNLDEFDHVRAPIPAIGGIVRYYVVPNISITGELSGIKIPASKTYDGHYADLDIYGTLNFTDNIGVQAGYRSIDVGYLIKTDSGSLTLKGLWFGLVARY